MFIVQCIYNMYVCMYNMWLFSEPLQETVSCEGGTCKPSKHLQRTIISIADETSKGICPAV